MIRGALVFLGNELSDKEPSNDVLLTAQAAELFQAGLLIHDDIMDNDETRRGKPSMHTQYTELMIQENAGYPKNTGKSMAICVGDTAFFLGYQCLSHIVNKHRKAIMMSLFSKELRNVCFAQMQDVYNGSSQRHAALSDILHLYQHKTGTYTITLPLTAGALLGNASIQTIRHIEQLGNNLGIAFQLTDDMLNLFGDPDITGKPTGSDIREGKQTPYIIYFRKEGIETKDISVENVLPYYKPSWHR